MSLRAARRKAYGASLVRDSYFVIKHLQRFLQKALDQYVTRGCRIGDIGCGEQPLRHRIEMLGGIYVGIDIDQNSSGTVDIVASASCVPLPNGSFDVIVCTEVVEHVSDTLSVFQEFFRLLAPKGYVILTTPFSYPLHEIPCDFVRLTPFQIEKLAHQSALDVVAMVRGGNEIEVMATVWDTMWRGMFGAKLNALSTVWIALMRALMNLPALVGSQLSGRFLPQRYYLSTLSILQRQSQTQ